MLCVIQGYAIDRSELANERVDLEKTEKDIVRICMNLINSRNLESVDDVLIKNACYSIYERLVAAEEESRNSEYSRFRRFFALPIAKNQQVHLPPPSTDSNTGFKYGKRR